MVSAVYSKRYSFHLSANKFKEKINFKIFFKILPERVLVGDFSSHAI